MGVGIILALVFTAVYVGCGEWVMELLSSDRPVVELARHYSVWAMMVPLVGFGAFLWDGVFIGLTRTRMMLISMATAMLTFFALYYLLFPMLGNHGLWIAFLGYLLMRGVVLTIAGREYLRSV